MSCNMAYYFLVLKNNQKNSIMIFVSSDIIDEIMSASKIDETRNAI